VAPGPRLSQAKGEVAKCAPPRQSGVPGAGARERRAAGRGETWLQLTRRGHTGWARLTFSSAAGRVLPPLALLPLTPHIACLAALSFGSFQGSRTGIAERRDARARVTFLPPAPPPHVHVCVYTTAVWVQSESSVAHPPAPVSVVGAAAPRTRLVPSAYSDGSLSPQKTFVLLDRARTASSWRNSGVSRTRLASASLDAR